MSGKSVCLWSCRLEFDSKCDQTNECKIGTRVAQPPCLTLSINGTVWRTSRQVNLLCRWERHSTGFRHHGVVDRWSASPKRARISLWSLSRDRRNILRNKGRKIDFNAMTHMLFLDSDLMTCEGLLNFIENLNKFLFQHLSWLCQTTSIS